MHTWFVNPFSAAGLFSHAKALLMDRATLDAFPQYVQLMLLRALPAHYSTLTEEEQALFDHSIPQPPG